ncbi:MAG: hypothetical protein ACRECX_11225 [Methyloceanibacter sp.]|uniref:hypothetical protein n=1 Tax=Methyloceanibacter sp. TaxID=1965321 RepID=UPI003D6D7EEF
MMDKSHEQVRDTGGATPNLGQKKAAREKASDEKLSHMEKGSSPGQAKHKEQKTDKKRK